MHKKRIVFIISLFMLIVVQNLFAQQKVEEIDCNWFTDTRIWNISINEDAVNYQDFKQFKLGIGIATFLDMKELTAKAGFCVGNKKLNQTAQITYAPTLYGKFNPGIRLINHYCLNFNYYLEQDFLIGPYVKFSPNSTVTLDFSFLYMQKLSHIFTLPQNNRLVYSNCPAFYFDLYVYPLDWMFINFTVSSYTFYRYYLFLSPDFKLALNFKANENLTLEIAGEIQSVDFFTMSANFNFLGFSIGANWRL